MGVGLSWKIERSGREVRIGLSGEITEDSNFEPLLTEDSSRVTIDLAGINRINSCGVREWVNFVGALRRKGQELVFERCSVPFVSQLNMIRSFRGDGEVRSVFAPYICTGCGEGRSLLLELNKDPVPDLSGTIPCPSCQKPMELDDLPDSYLAFRS